MYEISSMTRQDAAAIGQYLHAGSESTSSVLWIAVDAANPVSVPLPRGLALAFEDGNGYSVPMTHPNLDSTWRPQWLRVDTSTSKGSLLLQDSVEHALAELASDRLRQGEGRRIAGWISVHETNLISALEHVARESIRRDPELAAWETVHDAQDREALIRRLKNQDYYLSQAAKADYEEKAKKWAALRSGVEVPDAKKQSFNAARDARLALIVAVFEAFNLYKASAKAAASPGNERVRAQLTAARLATTSAVIDVVSNMVKGVAAAGDKAASYQVLKLAGGSLSVVASSYGAMMDVEDFDKEVAHQDYRMATLLVTRAIFQFTSVALTALTALSYCSPLIETFGKQFGERLAGRVALAAAERLLLARAALVFASLEVSIFVLAVTVLIWYFEDDALQKWCDRSAFGSRRENFKDAYGKADVQLEAYWKSLKEAL